MSSRSQGGGGCAAIIALFLVIAVVIAAVTSVAALIDPFSWVPPIGKIFACHDNPNTAVNECALGKRYPGLWWHVIVNFVYALAALGLLLTFRRTVREYREARSVRFDSDTALERYQHASQALIGVACLLGGLAAIPILVAAIS